MCVDVPLVNVLLNVVRTDTLVTLVTVLLNVVRTDTLVTLVLVVLTCQKDSAPAPSRWFFGFFCFLFSVFCF